jgi:hypothetical protein
METLLKIADKFESLCKWSGIADIPGPENEEELAKEYALDDIPGPYALEGVEKPVTSTKSRPKSSPAPVVQEETEKPIKPVIRGVRNVRERLIEFANEKFKNDEAQKQKFIKEVEAIWESSGAIQSKVIKTHYNNYYNTEFMENQLALMESKFDRDYIKFLVNLAKRTDPVKQEKILNLANALKIGKRTGEVNPVTGEIWTEENEPFSTNEKGILIRTLSEKIGVRLYPVILGKSVDEEEVLQEIKDKGNGPYLSFSNLITSYLSALEKYSNQKWTNVVRLYLDDTYYANFFRPSDEDKFNIIYEEDVVVPVSKDEQTTIQKDTNRKVDNITSDIGEKGSKENTKEVARKTYHTYQTMYNDYIKKYLIDNGWSTTFPKVVRLEHQSGFVEFYVLNHLDRLYYKHEFLDFVNISKEKMRRWGELGWEENRGDNRVLELARNVEYNKPKTTKKTEEEKALTTKPVSSISEW